MKRVYCLMILLLCATSVLLAQKKAEIEFKQTKYDFHEIAEENGDVSHVFTFINKGNAPLIITRASANCGCTKPEYPVKPVAPGKEGQIKVTYQPAVSRKIFMYIPMESRNGWYC